MAEANSGTKVDLFVEALLSACASAFSEKTGSPWKVVVDPSPQSTVPNNETVCFQLTLDGSPGEGAFLLSLNSAAALAAAGTASATLAPSEFQKEHCDALGHMFARACAVILTKSGFRHLKLKLHLAEDDIPWKAAQKIAVVATNKSAGRIDFELLLNSEMIQMLDRDKANLPEDKIAAAASHNEPLTNNLALLNDVSLEVTLRFGTRRLKLRQIGDLNTGSIIELDKHVNEPAELLLGERVIARGEVVIVGGNYGLRVTEAV